MSAVVPASLEPLPPRRAATSWRRWDCLVSAILFVAVLATYWPVRHFSYVRYDDDVYLFENPAAVHGLNHASAHWALTSLVMANYMPMPVLSLLADVSIWGLNAGPMHLENAMLHSISTIGWYLVWVALTGRRGRSFMVAAVFGLHPMHVEAVAWIAARGDLLCMPLMVGSLLGYVHFVRTGRRIFYWISLAFFPFAILSKTLAMVFPMVLLLINIWPLRRLQWVGRWRLTTASKSDPAPAPAITVAAFIVEMIPFLLLAMAGAALGYLGRSSMPIMIPLQFWTLKYRLANVVFGYSSYLVKLFAPEPMIVIYPLRTAFSNASVMAALGLLVLISVLAVRSFQRLPYLLVGWLWFVCTLLPTIGFVQSGMASMADRYTYLPYVGLSVAVLWLGNDILNFFTSRLPGIRVPMAFAVCALALIASITDARRQLQVWSSSYALYTHAYAVAPDDLLILKGVGTEYRRAGQLDQATIAYAHAVQLYPQDYDAETKLGGVLFLYDPRQALPHYQRAVHLAPQVPFCWWDLGLCQQRLQQSDLAATSFRKALQLDPNFEPAKQSLESLQLAGDGSQGTSGGR